MQINALIQGIHHKSFHYLPDTNTYPITYHQPFNFLQLIFLNRGRFPHYRLTG